MVCLIIFTGCEPDYYPEYESGFWKYAVKTEKDGTKKAYHIGLMESGLKQTALVYPEEIDGIEVYGLGYARNRIPGKEWVGNIESDMLEKIYFPTVQKENLSRGEIIYLEDGYAVYWDENFKLKTSSGGDMIDSTYMVYGYNVYLDKKDELKRRLIDFIIANVSYLYNYEDSANNGYYWVDSYI